MARLCIVSLVLAVSIGFSWMTARGDSVVVTRTSSDEYLVPVFNTALGTLTEVQIKQTLLTSSSTDVGGEHGHTYIGFPGISVSTVGNHTHTIEIPAATGNGLTLPSISHTTEGAGSHSHSLIASTLVTGGRTFP